MRTLPLVWLCWFGIAATGLMAQTVFKGTVRDAVTHEWLPAANLQIEGTYKGAISNMHGRFILIIDSLPAKILVRYIGYESKYITVSQPPVEDLHIELTPSPIEMEAIVVIGEDPAVQMMRRVIARKRAWHGQLHTFRADAYSRISLANDSGIVMISESLGDIHWDRKKGIRAVIKSKRSTKNVDPKDMVFSPDEAVVNFYDDDVLIQDSRFVGPTHPDALSYYDFRIADQRGMDGKTVYTISLNTRSKLQPTFVGTIDVIDEDSVMIGVDLKPSPYAVFPMPIQRWDVAYKQHFSNFGQAYWLPVDAVVNGSIKIGMPGLDFPLIHYGQYSALNNYIINPSPPDSLYQQKKQVVIDSISLGLEGLFDSAKVIIPLSPIEDSAYANIKHGDSFGKAFKPTGMLARFVKFDDEYNDTVSVEKPGSRLRQIIGNLGPQLGYNRVEGGRIGLEYEHPFGKTWKAHLRGGYATALREPFYGAGAEYQWEKRSRRFIRFTYYEGILPRFESESYAPWMAGIQVLAGYRDYFDYYDVRQFKLTGGAYLKGVDITLEGSLLHERHRSVQKTTDWDLGGRTYVQRNNPAIEEGFLRAIRVSARYGDEYVPLGVVPVKNVEIQIEHTPSAISDFDYTTLRGQINWRIPTFLRRRFMPNALDFHAVAGTFTGHLPIQRRAVLDGSLGLFTPSATFRTNRTRAMECDQYAAIFWEHHFRTVPFELLGMSWLAKKNIGVVVFGGHGWTKLQDTTTRRFHNEFGASLNGLFGFLRFDAARNLKTRQWYFGLSLARLI